MKRKIKMLPSNQRLNELLAYNPQTGKLSWKVNRRGTAKAGDVAGIVDNSVGYVVVCIDNVRYRAHRVCYKMATGWDAGMFEIDHINGNRSDNRISNLRMVDSATNSKNAALRKNNTSGYVGVYFNKKAKRWMARIYANKKWFYLGGFKNKEDAVAARAAAEVKHGFHVNHGRVA